MSRLRRIAARVPTVVLARRNVSRAKARSALAVAAVVIGVVAIGGIGAGGEAFEQDQLSAYEGFGGTATVDPVFSPDEPADSRTFSDRDIDRMRGATDGATVLPVVDPSGAVVTNPSGDPLVTVGVTGIGTPGEFYEAAEGEIPDNWRRSVVVGSRVAAENGIEPGDQITVVVPGEFQRTFRVAAVLRAQGFADPLNADRTVFVPLGQFEAQEYDRAIVRVDPRTGSVATAAERIESEFNVRERRVAVETVTEQREQFERLFGTLNQFLVGIGAVSLLVAAVTIANTMLMSAVEREGELGVLRAVGYPRRAVVSMLVAESAMLGLAGAAVGIPAALGVGAGINWLLLADPLAFTADALRFVGLGAAFGVATAVAGGLYPAWRAANKRPVEALE